MQFLPAYACNAGMGAYLFLCIGGRYYMVRLHVFACEKNSIALATWEKVRRRGGSSIRRRSTGSGSRRRCCGRAGSRRWKSYDYRRCTCKGCETLGSITRFCKRLYDLITAAERGRAQCPQQPAELLRACRLLPFGIIWSK